MAIAPTPVVLKTIFVEQTVHGTDSSRMRATITAMNYGKGSRSHDDPSHWVEGLVNCFAWGTLLICEVSRGILLCLRQLFDFFFALAPIFIAPVVSWRLAKIHNQAILEGITAVHEMEIAEANAGSDLLITALQGQTKAQESRLAEAQAGLASLGSRLTDRDNEIARLGDSLAEAKTRADTAELSNKAIEKKAKTARSDLDSALQKKENEVNTHKNARAKAAEDRDTARAELKAAKAEAVQDKKQIAKLQKRAANASGLQDQLSEKDAIIGQKDGIIRGMREEATRSSKAAQKAKATDRDHLRELQGRIANAEKLRDDAAAKASRKEQESKAKDEKIEDFKSSCAYRERRITSLEAAHDKLRAAYEKEQAEGRDAAAKALETEETLRKRVAELEEQIRGMSASSNVAAHASPQERSTSSQPNAVVVPPSGPRRARYVAPANGETFSNPEAKGLPADTPRGPKGGSRGGR